MTGKGILEALSYVDEAYIEEAEKGTLRGNLLLRKVLPMAACLCLVLFGLRFWDTSGDHEAQADVDADSSRQEAVMEPECDAANSAQEPDDCIIELDKVETPYTSEVPTVILMIEEWNAVGFTASVVRNVDSATFEPGEALRIIFAENICVEEVISDLVTVYRRLPTELEFPAGTQVLVQYQYHTEDGTLCIDYICKEVE